MAAPRNVLMLAFPNAQLLDVTGPLQMFAAANDELSRAAYRIEIAAPSAGPFATASSVRLVADMSFAQVTSRRLARTHTLLAAGGDPGMRTELARGAVTDIVARAIGRVPRIASVCSGASSWPRPARWTAGGQPRIGASSTRSDNSAPALPSRTTPSMSRTAACGPLQASLPGWTWRWR